MSFARKVLLAALAVALFPGTAAADRLSEMLAVIPAGAQAVLIAPDPAATAAEIRKLAASFTSNPPASLDGIGPGMLLQVVGIRGVPDGIDPTGPAALAVPLTPHPVVIVAVTDYERLIAGLVAAGGPEASVTRDPGGVDLLRLKGRSVSARHSGGFALLAAQPFLLGAPAPGASLRDALAAEELALLRESEFFVRLGARSLADLVEPLLRARLAGPPRRPARPPGGAGTERSAAAPDPASESVRRLLNVEIELLVRGLRQAEALDFGLRIDASSVGLALLARPAAGSGFEGIVASLGPGDHGLLRLAAADSLMAGSSAMDFAPWLGVAQEVLGALAEAVDTPEAREAVAGLAVQLRSWADVAGPRSVWFAVASPEAPPFVMFAANEVSDAAAARSFAHRSFELARGLLAGLAPGESLPELAVSAGEHRGVPVDHVRLRLPILPGAAARAKGRDLPFPDGIVHAWLAYPPGLLLGCYYTADPGPMRAFLDRVLDGRDGGLATDPGFALAKRFLPPAATSLGYFSLSRLFENTARLALREGGAAIPPLSEQASRAVLGMAAYRAGRSIRTDLSLPINGLDGLASALRGLRPPSGPGPAPPAEPAPGGSPAPRE